MRRQWRLYLLALSLVLVVGGSAPAQRDDGVTFTTIDPPGATFTAGRDITPAGDAIVGRYRDTAGVTHGFLLSSGTYTTIDFPGGTFTGPEGINAGGDIVGVYFDFSTIDVPGATSTSVRDFDRCTDSFVGSYHDATGNHGFLLQDGVFSAIDFPSAKRTDAHGINGNGDIVGTYQVPEEHGFLLNRQGFTSVDFPGALSTSLQGINSLGVIVGGYCDDIATCFPEGTHGFILREGSFQSFDVPDAVLTNAQRINSQGVVAGSYKDSGGAFHGFTKDNNTFETIDFPGALVTIVLGINEQGDVAGSYCDQAPCGTLSSLNHHAFVRKCNTFLTLDFPDAIGTRAYSINDRGDLVGVYRDSLNVPHGFLAIAPGSGADPHFVNDASDANRSEKCKPTFRR